MSLQAALKELRQNAASLPLTSQTAVAEQPRDVDNGEETIQFNTIPDLKDQDAVFQGDFLENADCGDTGLSDVVWSTVRAEQLSCAPRPPGALRTQDATGKGGTPQPLIPTTLSMRSEIAPLPRPSTSAEPTSASSSHERRPLATVPLTTVPLATMPLATRPLGEVGVAPRVGEDGMEQGSTGSTDAFFDDIDGCFDDVDGYFDDICFDDIDGCFGDIDSCFDEVDDGLDGIDGGFDDAVCSAQGKSPPKPTLGEVNVLRVEQRRHGLLPSPTKRRFPGPAGALAKTTTPGCKYEGTTRTPELLPPQTPCLVPAARKRGRRPSQSGEPCWDSKAWTQLQCDHSLHIPSPPRHTISKVLAQARKNAAGLKVPLLAVFIKSVQLTRRNASIHIKDPTGEMRGTVQAEVLERLGKGSLQPGSAMLLRQASILSPSPRRHYLSVTLCNVVSVYSPEGQLVLSQTFSCGSQRRQPVLADPLPPPACS